MDLLTEMRMQVSFTHVATMPIPLYEKIKAYIEETDGIKRLVNADKYIWKCERKEWEASKDKLVAALKSIRDLIYSRQFLWDDESVAVKNQVEAALKEAE